MTNSQVAEHKQELEDQLNQLMDNPLFKEARELLKAQLQTRRKEQRSALLKSDSNAVFRLEAEIKGIEEFFNVVDSFYKRLDKLKEGVPTTFKY